jgi:hypothetical protein
VEKHKVHLGWGAVTDTPYHWWMRAIIVSRDSADHPIVVATTVGPCKEDDALEAVVRFAAVLRRNYPGDEIVIQRCEHDY